MGFNGWPQNEIDLVELTTKYNWTNISTTYDQNNIKNKDISRVKYRKCDKSKVKTQNLSMFHQKYINVVENVINMKFDFTCN
jgi:cellobiose-specific phosphotransferase system component IIB